MSEVTIYTIDTCPYCRAAKTFLNRKGVDFTEIDVTTDIKTKRKVMDELGWRTVPMIIVNGKFIGGYDDMKALDRENKLDRLLSKEN